MVNLEIDAAKNADLQFIIEAILESERAGTQNIAYCSLFDITPDQFGEILLKLFDDELEHTPWYLPYWRIGRIDGQSACALTAWIEPSTGLGSEALKLQALYFYLKDHISKHQFEHKLQLLQQVNLERFGGYLQLDHLYTKPCHQKNGLMKILIHHTFLSFPAIETQIQTTANNTAALSLYEKCGFTITDKKCLDGLFESGMLAANCKINLIRKNG